VTVRFRLALTILLTGLATAIGVIVAVAVAFQRFEHESTWQRGDAFLGRVVALHDDLLDQQARSPVELTDLLRTLLVFEPDSQLYLLDAQGTVLASTGMARLPPGFKVNLPPVQQAAAAAASGDGRRGAYVMGDDPEYMDHDAVVAARSLQRAQIRAASGVAGYLYLVCRKPGLPAQRLALLRSTAAGPALLAVGVVCLLTALLGAWIIANVTRPLRVLSDEVAAVARAGFSADADVEADGAALVSGVPGGAGGLGRAAVAQGAPQQRAHDEFSRLRSGFLALLGTLRMQWDELKRLDQFRRESVSNLSHDLRSPLTATVACLETLEARWQGAAPAAATVTDSDRRLVAVALRNTRNAAGLVRSLGDLALLDEPQFQLKPMRLDLAEVLDDIALRYADRAARQGVRLQVQGSEGPPPVAAVDAELFERAVANLLDNALKFTPAGGSITLGAQHRAAAVQVTVADTGAGIAPADLPHLFDRLYQSRSSVAPASSEEGKGLGLAIVKRIAELHGGTVAVASSLGGGTAVTLALPA
jgi:signal transduction histidine kinase